MTKKHEGRKLTRSAYPQYQQRSARFPQHDPHRDGPKRREKLDGFPVFRGPFTIPEINKQLDGNVYRMRQIHRRLFSR